MRRLIPALLLSLIAAPAAADRVTVDIPCMSWTEAKVKYKARSEEPVSRALIDAEALLVITASSDGGSWSLFAVRPDGKTCILAWGTDYDPGRLAEQSQ